MSRLRKPRIRRARGSTKAAPTAIATVGGGRYPTIDALLSDVDPALPPAQRARFEARKAFARGALAKLKTLEEWRSTATPALIREAVEESGSLEASYAQLVSELERESVTPSPSGFHFYPDGSVTGVW